MPLLCSTAGLVVRCERGFYNPNINAADQTACISCPPHSTTEGEASTGLHQCRCDSGYYDDGNDGVHCVVCMLGALCDDSGITLRSLPLLPGWWRSHLSSEDVRQCPDGTRDSSGCTGGTGQGCKEHLTGPCKCIVSNSIRRTSPIQTRLTSCSVFLQTAGCAIALGSNAFTTRVVRSARRAVL